MSSDEVRGLERLRRERTVFEAAARGDARRSGRDWALRHGAWEDVHRIAELWDEVENGAICFGSERHVARFTDIIREASGLAGPHDLAWLCRFAEGVHEVARKV